MTFVETVVAATLGAGIIKAIDFAVDSYRQDQQRRKEKVATLLQSVREFGDLAGLYRFFARQGSRIVTDERHELVKDEAGKYVVEESALEPDPRFERAMMALQETSLRGAIDAQLIRVRLRAAETSDLAHELDPSGALARRFQELYWRTATLVDLSIKHEDFNGMVSALQEAAETRRAIRSVLERSLEPPLRYPWGELRRKHE